MKNNHPSETVFEMNLEHFAHIDPFEAQRIALVESSNLFFCYTNQEELNLQTRVDGQVDYYHSQEGAEEESKAFYRGQDLSQTTVIYQYGIGLGYDYLALKNWLEEDPQRRLVFFEDNSEVMFAFLHTPLANEILTNNQVSVCSFRTIGEDSYKFNKVHCRFFSRFPAIYTLRYYERNRKDDVYLFHYVMSYESSLLKTWSHEIMEGGLAFFDNFYRNMLYLPDSYSGSGLEGQFRNVPAIICGAGPSLHKNIELLKTLKDRALIFAGGSSLNILNAYGLDPHFGAGLDPNPEQIHRIISNHSFDIPFLYSPRMKADALRLVPGESLYISGTGEYDVVKWFESQMDLVYPSPNVGYNVINFCTFLAGMMGCNPIIFVGMDLAYTESKSYEAGIPTHPLWLGQNSPYAINKEVDIVTRKDIYGNPINTKWQWIYESSWVLQFSNQFPHVNVINATEGGIGMCNVSNMSLAETAEKHLYFQYDFPNWMHEEIQNNPLLKATRNQMWTLLTEWNNSMKRCLDHSKALAWEFKEHSKPRAEENKSLKAELYTPEALLTEVLMQEELAYNYLIESLLGLFIRLQTDQIDAIHRASQQDTIDTQLEKYRQILEERYRFVVQLLENNIQILDRVIRDFLTAPSHPTPKGVIACNPEEIIEKDTGRYRVEDEHLIIDDPELNIHIETPYEPHQKITQDRQNGWSMLFYPDGQVKLETPYKKGQIHGPSKSYSPENKLLAISWFVEGVRQGKSWRFFPSGHLYGLQRYRDGKLHGIQEVFYEDGQRKTVINYSHGVLEGDVWAYYPNGIPQRELHYRNGKRHGKERVWNPSGKLMIEAEYEDGIPVGTARQWTAKGHMIREVVIREFPDQYDSVIFNDNGNVIRRIIDNKEDSDVFLEAKESELKFFDETIHAFMAKIEKTMQSAEITNPEQFAKEISEVKDRVKHFEELHQQIKRMIQEKEGKAKPSDE